MKLILQNTDYYTAFHRKKFATDHFNTCSKMYRFQHCTHVMYKQKTLLVVMLEYSEITGDYKTPDRDRRTKQIVK